MSWFHKDPARLFSKEICWNKIWISDNSELSIGSFSDSWECPHFLHLPIATGTAKATHFLNAKVLQVVVMISGEERENAWHVANT